MHGFFFLSLERPGNCLWHHGQLIFWKGGRNVLELLNVNLWLNQCTEVSMDEKIKEVLKFLPFITCAEISGECFVPRELLVFV